MNKVTIETLKVNPTKPLTPMIKANLVKIICSEFHTQTTLYNAQAIEQKEKILVQYRKVVGFVKMKADYDKAQVAVDMAHKKRDEIQCAIEKKGLNIHGEAMRGSYNSTPEQKKAVDKINALFATIEAMSPNRMKSKIEARLWLADTQGEACVILEQVLGNGVIPSMTENLLTQQ